MANRAYHNKSTYYRRERVRFLKKTLEAIASGEYDFAEEYLPACNNCEHRFTCCDYGVGNHQATREARNQIFRLLHDSPTTRKQFQRRIAKREFRLGEYTAFCATLCRPGHLSPTKDYIR